LKKNPEQLKSTSVEPVLFRVAKYLQRADIRGGYRLEKIVGNLGWLDVNVRYDLPNGVKIDIPIAERSYDLFDIRAYESASVNGVAPILTMYDADFCLLDCGADIGLMSAKFVSAIPSIKKIVAFEPNKISFRYLENNMTLLGINSQAKNMALSDFSGSAEMTVPDFDSTDHAAFIVPDEHGDFEVCSIDSLDLPNTEGLFLKVDVEGAELSVIRGARETIATTKHVVVLFEAHHKQVARTGIDPVEIINYLNSIKQCETLVMESPGTTIDLDRPFFEQLPRKIFNVCVYSK
jgi:FkbM family methyltransferase